VRPRYLYLVASLPALGDPGEPPPLAPRELLSLLDPGPRALAEIVFLADDLLRRESHLAGDAARDEPAVLTAAQLRNEAPLPDELAPLPAPGASPVAASDRAWQAFFVHAAAVAERHRSTTLAAWVRFEVGLRNALAAERARRLGLDPVGFLVAPEIGLPAASFRAAVRAWSEAEDPLAAERVLDGARRAWLERHDAWFEFTADELVAYAARLALAVRWQQRARPRSVA